MKENLLLAALAAMAALILAAAGSSSLEIAPEFSTRLVQGVVCPAGQTLEYRELGVVTVTDADGTYQRVNISVSCVAPDGTRESGKSGATIAALTGLYFAICFGPLFVGAVVFRRVMVRRQTKGRPGSK